MSIFVFTEVIKTSKQRMLSGIISITLMRKVSNHSPCIFMGTDPSLDYSKASFLYRPSLCSSEWDANLMLTVGTLRLQKAQFSYSPR
jgi:hypothetical protein